MIGQEWVFQNFPDKCLNKFLISLPIKECKALFNGLIMGDGHIRKDDKRIAFIQKNKKMRDWFQILAMRLGYHPIATRDIFLTLKQEISMRGTNGKGGVIKKVYYKGKVWCPKVKNGTWVARRNGKIFITGNTFPVALLFKPILSSCPKNGITLDPFSGSGTTSLVAKVLKRNYVGIDISEKYVQMSEGRIKNLEEQEKVMIKLKEKHPKTYAKFIGQKELF